jgi:inosine/xanthosine triphosphatase
MTKEPASKKKATKTPKGKAKAREPETPQPEPKAGDVVQEQTESKSQAGSVGNKQEQAIENRPVKKARVSRKSKKKAKPAAGEEKQAVADTGAKPVAEQKADAQADLISEADTAQDADGSEAKPAEKPKTKRKEKAKKVVVPAVEAKAEPEPEIQTTATKKKPKKKPAKKKTTEPGQEQMRGVQRVVVASGNPAKIKAAELGFSRMFPDKEFAFEGVPVGSGVADQPMTDDETFAGALNRAISARQEQSEADFWIGLEGGLQEEGDDFYAFAWIVILGPEGLVGKSRTGTFAIPPAVTELVRSGKELGEADDIVFSQTNSKQSSGAIGILTHGILDRANYYAQAVLMALIPFKNVSLYLLQEEVEEEV